MLPSELENVLEAPEIDFLPEKLNKTSEYIFTCDAEHFKNHGRGTIPINTFWIQKKKKKEKNYKNSW